MDRTPPAPDAVPRRRRPALAAAALAAAWTLLPLGLAPPGGERPGPGRTAAEPSGLAAQEPADAASQEEEDEKEEGLPLEPARTIPIDLDRGTWISLDVSPDGETIVFDFLGDLFTVPIEGGEATRLTSGMAFDAQPRFSPDGERIVFTSDRDGGQNLWVLSLDGSDTIRISRGETNRAESPDWTADGDYVVAAMGAFRGEGLPKLTLFHVEGGTGMKLVGEEREEEDGPRGRSDDLKTLGPAVSPDGRYIWFAQRRGDWTYNADLPQYQLAVYDRETGKTYQRTSRYGSGMRPTLSPDGRWLVYGTRHDDRTGLVLRDLETGEERWLAYPVQHDDQESRATLDLLPGMSFTPDSRHLVASWDGRIWKVPVAGGPAEEIPFRVRFDLEVGPELFFDYPIDDTPTFTVRQIRDAVPSPDGARLAFTALDRLWVAGADGSSPRRLTDGAAAEHFPAWSPDGRWLAYATWEGEAGHLWKVRADGRGEPVRLTDQGGLYLSPAWSPAGDRIVALRGFARSYQESSSPFAAYGAPHEIVWVASEPGGDGGSGNARSGGPVRLIAPTDGRSAPHFTNDPDRIYLFKDPDLLVSIRWDGTDEREHVKIRGPKPPNFREALSPSVILASPTGDRAMALIQRHLYAVTVPAVGRTPTIDLARPERAAFPARRLTDIGGEFPAWSANGRAVHWSLGNAHFVYDLEAAEAFEDSVKAAERAAGGEGEEEDQESGDEEKRPRYEPAETRVRIEAERDLPRGVAVLRGARAITMDGDLVIENADILVRDNRIVAIGPWGEVEVPEEARAIDLSGTTVVPGYIDTHAHMWPPWGVHRSDPWLYLANLAYGVTTTRDPQTSSTDVLTYADRVRTGEILGPRVYSTGPGVFWQDVIESREEAENVLRRYSDYFDTKTIKMYVAGARKARQWIAMAARELGLMPTTEGSLNIKQNITETIDGYPGLEHSVPIYPIQEDLVTLFAEMGRAYTPTLLVSYGGPWAENYFFSRENPHDDAKLRRFTPHEDLDRLTRRRGQWFMEAEHVFPDHARFVRDLVEAGGRAGVGSHGQLQGLGYHWELWAMASAGMDPHDALRMATIQGAEAIGLDGDLGSLEPGKLADLVVLDGNPLDDLRHTNAIRYVMKNGRLYDGDTLDEVWPRERRLPEMWWWEEDPTGVPGADGVP